ncbi:MAG TPA: amidase [Vicinamibacterales bacterium]|nr:amidase [Vicinamibacterales bacterium]
MPASARTIAELARAIRSGELTAETATTDCLERIAERNPAINAYITVLADQALAQAKQADAELKSGRDRGPLHGVPISLKDIIDLDGVSTTAASKVRHGHVAPHDAPVVARLREAGAVFLGKTNLHEFAFGTTNEDSAFGLVRHPLDPNRSPGGSSGGSAASVLDGMAYASIGTDTGGSVRIPSAACGLVGLKPSLDEVPIGGVFPLSKTMDHVGPLCRSVEDAAIVHDVLCGRAPSNGSPRNVNGLRIGVLRGYFTTLLDPQVAAAFETTCKALTAAGAALEEVQVPHAGDIAPIYLHIVLSEAAALHAKTLDSHAEDYNPNVRLRLEMGRYILAEDYLRALRGRDVLIDEVDATLVRRDALLLPTLAVPAVKLGALAVKIGSVEEPVRNITLRLTQLFNITGHPAITIPCGATTDGLPIGAQLAGGRNRTGDLLAVAAAVESLLRPNPSR